MAAEWVEAEIRLALLSRGYLSVATMGATLHYGVMQGTAYCEHSLSPVNEMIEPAIKAGVIVVDFTAIERDNVRFDTLMGLPLVRCNGAHWDVAYPDADWSPAHGIQYIDVRLYVLFALVRGARVHNPPVEYSDKDKARALAWWTEHDRQRDIYRAEREQRLATRRTEDEEAAADWAERHSEPVEFRGTTFDVPNWYTVRGWTVEETCEALDGCTVEPDGTCHHGYPSWLIQLGLMGAPVSDRPTGNQAYGY